MSDEPAIVVTIRLEARARGMIVALHDEDACRVGRWAERHRDGAHEALDDAIDAAIGECRHIAGVESRRAA